MNAQEARETAVVLLTLTHPDLPQPLRLSSYPAVRTSEVPLEYVTYSRGQTFRFFPFAIVIPDDVQERAPVAQLQIENVTRSLVALIRSTNISAVVAIELAVASALDEPFAEFGEFDLQRVTYDADVMTLELSTDALTDIPYPSGSFTPAGFPGLF